MLYVVIGAAMWSAGTFLFFIALLRWAAKQPDRLIFPIALLMGLPSGVFLAAFPWIIIGIMSR